MTFIGFEPDTENADGSAIQTNDRVESANLYALGLKALVKFVPGHLIFSERNFDGPRPNVRFLAPHGVFGKSGPYARGGGRGKVWGTRTHKETKGSMTRYATTMKTAGIETMMMSMTYSGGNSNIESSEKHVCTQPNALANLRNVAT